MKSVRVYCSLHLSIILVFAVHLVVDDWRLCVERELSMHEIFDDLASRLLHIDNATLLQESTFPGHLRQ